MKKLSVVICARNEAESLPVLLPKLYEVLNGLDLDFEILLADDASTDGTGDYLAEFAKAHPRLIHLRLPVHGGQTECFRKAFAEARGEFIIRMDADLQDDPEDVPKFVEMFDQGADLIMGLRECRKHQRVLRLASAVFDLMILALFDTPLHSNTGSFVGFRTELVRDIPFRRNDHRYIPLIAIKRGAGTINEVIVSHSARQYGVSHYKPLKKLVLGVPEVLSFLVRLYWGAYDLPAPQTGQQTAQAELARKQHP